MVTSSITTSRNTTSVQQAQSPITHLSNLALLCPVSVRSSFTVGSKGIESKFDPRKPIPTRLIFSIDSSEAAPRIQQHNALQNIVEKKSRVEGYLLTQKCTDENKGGLSRVDLEQCRLYFPGDINMLKNIIRSGTKFVINLHGLNESSAFYDPSLFKSDAVQQRRFYSRADQQLSNNQIPVIVSNKLPRDNQDAEKLAQLEAIYNNHGVTSPAIQSVDQLIQFCKSIGSPLQDNQIVLNGKSRGAYAAVASMAQLIRKPEIAPVICLEAPILNAANTLDAFLKSYKIPALAQKITNIKPQQLVEGEDTHSMFSMEDALDDLRKASVETGKFVTLNIARFDEDSVVGNKQTNEDLTNLFKKKCNIIDEFNIDVKSLEFTSTHQKTSANLGSPLSASLYTATGTAHGINGFNITQEI